MLDLCEVYDFAHSISVTLTHNINWIQSPHADTTLAPTVSSWYIQHPHACVSTVAPLPLSEITNARMQACAAHVYRLRTMELSLIQQSIGDYMCVSEESMKRILRRVRDSLRYKEERKGKVSCESWLIGVWQPRDILCCEADDCLPLWGINVWRSSDVLLPCLGSVNVHDFWGYFTH